jgi:hypothetical protein
LHGDLADRMLGEPIVQRQEPGGHCRKAVKVTLDLAVGSGDKNSGHHRLFVHIQPTAACMLHLHRSAPFSRAHEGASWGREGTIHFRPRAHLTSRGDPRHRRGTPGSAFVPGLRQPPRCDLCQLALSSTAIFIPSRASAEATSFCRRGGSTIGYSAQHEHDLSQRPLRYGMKVPAALSAQVPERLPNATPFPPHHSQCDLLCPPHGLSLAVFAEQVEKACLVDSRQSHL